MILGSDKMGGDLIREHVTDGMPNDLDFLSRVELSKLRMNSTRSRAKQKESFDLSYCASPFGLSPLKARILEIPLSE